MKCRVPNILKSVNERNFAQNSLHQTLKVCWVIALIILTNFSHAQMTIGGSSASLPNNCYRLTSAANALSGYAYDSQSIDLNNAFDYSFSVNLGNNDAGADGIMFVLRASLDPSQLIAGGTGGDIGFTGTGFGNGSVGIEIDTYQNGAYGDPSFDHFGIHKNASANHNLSTSLIAPVQASSTSANIEDGIDHSFRVAWNPTTTTLSIYFDCDLRLEYTGDIVTSIFAGNPNVYYGFIGTTGGVNNVQSFCYAQPIDSFLIDLVNDSICKGESVQLAAGTAPASFSWSPSAGLSASNVPNPIASPAVSTDYIVTADYLCETKTDTVNIHVFETDGNTFSLGNDTTICTPDAVTFDLSATNYVGYIWQDGSIGKQYTSNTSEQVIISITDVNQCTFSDTVNVQVNNTPILSLGADKTSCNGEIVNLSSPFPASGYLWSNGGLSSAISTSTAGTYWLRVTQDGICFATDTIIVKTPEAPQLELGNDTTICANLPLELSAALSNADQYVWSTDEQGSTIFVKDSGYYWVEVKLGQCFYSDSILVTPKPSASLDLGADTSICRGDTFSLNGSLPNAVSFQWSDGFQDSTRTISVSGIYSLQVIFENGCETFGEIEIFESICATTLIMPNVFSPNNDGINDLFEVYKLSGIESADVRIYNRWGESMYRGTLETPWDGTINGRLCPSGPYFYTVDFIDVYGKSSTEQGSLTLIR